jgi:hypothetical protein
MPKVARNKFLPDGEAGVGSKHHIGQFRLRRHQLDFAVERFQRLVQTLPL